ncbi:MULTISPECIES: histidine kinase [unclassified Micromonospora]|uniref:sensor histidine kinase n=1 Tax=unclassified Micromonospora TaxID=2617518 RepID=UPI0022B63B25|nr:MULTISPECIES: histidine kinase [unclassified Micromonospora]MCZ7421952.1 histidine kinase [Verrucosispora sp. WMMA2121]WBB94465.1 histidine kinase [Verrucosispora sp. WMMC514]
MRLGTLRAEDRDLLIVVGSIATGALLYIADLYPLYVSGSTDPAPMWMRVGLFIAICATELLRRKAPVVALVLGAVIVTADTIHGPSIPVLLVFADLLYAATLYGPARLHRDMAPIAAGGLLVVVVASFLMQQDWRQPLMGSVTALPFIVIPIWWATNVRQHRNIAEVERANARQLAKIARLDRSAAIAAERARMARDLHDIIAGHLSSIAIQSEAVLSMNGEDPVIVRRVLASVRQNSVQALEEMGSMIRLLRADGTGADETEAPTGLSDLPRMVESVRASGMQLEVDCQLDDDAPLPAAVDLTAYRVTQEALINVLKHAPQAKARVDIRHETDKLIVEVTNDLPGRLPAAAPVPEIGHNGLLNMRERATVVGGTFSAGPRGGSWLVRAVLPATGSES